MSKQKVQVFFQMNDTDKMKISLEHFEKEHQRFVDAELLIAIGEHISKIEFNFELYVCMATVPGKPGYIKIASLGGMTFYKALKGFNLFEGKRPQKTIGDVQDEFKKQIKLKISFLCSQLSQEMTEIQKEMSFLNQRMRDSSEFMDLFNKFFQENY